MIFMFVKLKASQKEAIQKLLDPNEDWEVSPNHREVRVYGHRSSHDQQEGYSIS
jgi:hypothetical protein